MRYGTQQERCLCSGVARLMPIKSVSIGGDRIVLAAYNPRTAKTMLYCSFVLAKIEEAMRSVTEDDANEWIRKNVPDGGELLDLLEDGYVLEETRGLPTTPGEERFELPIIAWLRQERRAQSGVAS